MRDAEGGAWPTELCHKAIGGHICRRVLALQFVQKCEKCQRFGKDIHQLAEQLNSITSHWPFDKWGIDIVGPMPRSAGNFRFLIVATDYFTK